MNLLVGIIGMVLLLTGFALNIFKIKRENTFTYIVLNILGGGLSIFYAVALDAVPFIILETIWTIFAIYKLFAVYLERRVRTGV